MSTIAARWSRSRSTVARRARRRATSSSGERGSVLWGGWARSGGSACVCSILPGLMRVELGAVEADDAIASHLLRDIQRVVSRTDQRVAFPDPRVRPAGDAEAGRATQRATGEGECMPLDAFAHPFGEGHRGVEHGAREQEHELLATVAADAVDLPRLLLEDRRQLLEHLVARLVAVGVVDALEVVQVAHDAREWLIEPLGVMEHLLQPVVQVAPVVEPREAVRLRHVAEALVDLEQLALALLQRLLEALDAQHRANPRLQLGEVDRLGDVVVGTRLEPLHLGLGGVERGLHDDGDEG